MIIFTRAKLFLGFLFCWLPNIVAMERYFEQLLPGQTNKLTNQQIEAFAKLLEMRAKENPSPAQKTNQLCQSLVQSMKNQQKPKAKL